MFEYVIELVVPSFEDVNTEDVKAEDGNPEDVSTEKLISGNFSTVTLATYNFNPGLEVGESVWISEHWGTWEDEPFNFEAVVTRYRKEIIPCRKSESKPDVFRIVIFLEAVEKDNLARMREIIRRLNSSNK
ncbi:hypothetical protein [Coleofasciculus sp. LEGE 07081]|nr:hypothetical protein [Coleofasciculus sp. LEGE 07081]